MAQAATTRAEGPTDDEAPARGANWSLALLLAINLFNYVDRQVLSAVESKIETDPRFHGVTQAKMGLAGTAFLISYILIAPIFGWLADRMSRWVLVAIGVIVWSLASGGTGAAGVFGLLLLSRCFVGVGEAAYGPVAPTILSDLYPIKHRGRVLSWFYLAIPVGSALGYVLGGLISARYGWRAAFYAVVPPGILLGVCALLMKDPRQGAKDGAVAERKATLADYRVLLHTPSYVLNTLGMAAMTFALGGIAFWMPKYVVSRYDAAGLRRDLTPDQLLAHVNIVFGGILVVSGLVATMAGGIAGDRLRKRYSGSYFLVSGAAMVVAFPLILLLLYTPFPLAWGVLFLSVFCLFFNTGPTNTALANVTHPSMRASAFAINILMIHLFGDAFSPALIGWIADHTPGNSLRGGFTVVSFLVLAGGILWLWAARYLGRDTELAPGRLGGATA